MPLLTDKEVSEKISELSGWERSENAISKSFQFDSFKTAMSVMNAIAFEAEDMNHHPDWSNVYNNLNISLSTHDAGGITEKDIELAQRIEHITSKYI